MNLKLLLKRGAIVAAANWPMVAIQFAAQATFQVLLAVPIIGAAILVSVLLGADLGNLLQGSLREIFTTIATALVSEPVALLAFIAAFVIALAGGSVLMFLIKGGIVDAFLVADETVGPVEGEPLAVGLLTAASRFDIRRFIEASARLFRRYLILGVALMVVYVLTGVAYLAFIVYGYRAAGSTSLMIGWTVVAALSTVTLVLWITAVNLMYLLLQIVTAAEDVRFGPAFRSVVRFVRAEFVELGGVFLVILGLVIGATVASALAWSGVALVAFIPLIGLAVFPLQIAALVVRGLVFEYIGLVAMGAYITLYRRHAARDVLVDHVTASAVRSVSSAG